MRLPFSLLLLTAFLLPSCTQSYTELLPIISSQPTSATSPLAPPTFTSLPPTRIAATEFPTPLLTLSPPTPTIVTVVPSTFTFKRGSHYPLDRPLIAYNAGSTQNKFLHLADPAEGAIYEFSLPNASSFATPFLAGLSPDALYFVYFEGGWLEILYDVEHLRASTPELVLHVLALPSGKVIFSIPLLSSSYPHDLIPVAETIKDEWHFTFQNAPFEEVVAATQEMMLDYIRRVTWSPDGSLLAFASQNPGPTSDLYLFSPKLETALRVNQEPGHVLKTIWTPDSSALVTVSSLYERHAREDTTYLLSREGSLLASFKSQRMFFNNWHDSNYGLLYEGTDSGDFYDLKTLSAADGTITMRFEGTYADIAYSPDLSTFLLSSNMPTAPIPAHVGLYLGKRGDSSLRTLSEILGWEVEYWGSENFAFAASSFDEGTIGVTQNGEVKTIDDGYWKLVASPSGRYLAGFFKHHPSYRQGIVPGLRIFDGDGQLLEFIDDTDITCVSWNAASTALAYQAESRLYLWDAATGSTLLISDQLNEADCAFKWVLDTPFVRSPSR